MSAVFTTVFTDALIAEPTALDGATIKQYLFTNAPVFASNDSRYLGITTISELSGQIGWGSPIAQSAASLTLATRDSPASPPEAVWRYLIQSNPFDLPNDFPDSRIVAAAYECVTSVTYPALSGKLLFIFDTVFRTATTVLQDNDSLIPAERADLLGASSNRYLLRWKPSASPAAPEVGPIVIQYGAPAFEAPRTQHVWLYPQRVNLIANPSFENDPITHWRTNGAVERISGAAPGDGGGGFHGHFTGSSPLIIESNYFPTQVRKEVNPEGWTLQFQMRGDGSAVKIGLVSWPSNFEATVVDWGPEEENWYPISTNWTQVRSLRRLTDVYTGMLRIETDGSFLDLDHVCCEPGWMPRNYSDWPYFDGDSTFGALDDHSWYSPPDAVGSRKHQTYSTWYNHRRAVLGRLFAQKLSPEDTGPGAVITDTEVLEWGMAYIWVPAGTPVKAHLDVLYPFDPQSPVPDVSGLVIPYRPVPDTPADATKIVDPWPMIRDAAHTMTSDVVAINQNPEHAFHTMTSDNITLA